MQVTEPDPMSRPAAIAYAIILPLALLALIFIPAGRLDWRPGWVFIGFLLIAFGASAWVLARVNPVIFRARSRFQPGTERWDLLLVALICAGMTAEIPLAALDAGRMRWSAMPLPWVILGYALLCAGIVLGTWAQAVNRFFEPGVRLQRERGQRVVTAGPYALIRHPGYASAILVFAGLALALASWWALLPAGWATALLILRTRWEDAVRCRRRHRPSHDPPDALGGRAAACPARGLCRLCQAHPVPAGAGPLVRPPGATARPQAGAAPRAEAAAWAIRHPGASVPIPQSCGLRSRATSLCFQWPACPLPSLEIQRRQRQDTSMIRRRPRPARPASLPA
ncbi:methyltransferase family protein [Siccirubricoccus phaeus]|uniref:methyltransferase family protein n=1 Tax=Siccirubricoccus phaeus TaxID=2595053 RepID=UPI001A9C6D6D|nr:isoprenylcysteine carboxylmethyltransferase family protein [Siccirubricoccus phaeus]